jgi:signal transduction histidine kinase
MLKQAVCREQRLLARSLQSIQGNSPIPAQLPAVSRMVALICHDLRLPLTAILANAEFLSQSDISEMERELFYEKIRWSIDRMNELVSSLLECSKDRDTFRPAAQNIVDTVECAIRMTGCETEVPGHHHQASSQRLGRGLVRFPSHRTSGRQSCLECLRGGFSRLGAGRDNHERKPMLLANWRLG